MSNGDTTPKIPKKINAEAGKRDRGCVIRDGFMDWWGEARREGVRLAARRLKRGCRLGG